MSNREPSSARSPEPANLGWAPATLLRDYQKQVEAALAGLPGGSRAFLVMSLVQRETCQSQVAIADRIALDKPTLTYLLDGLEKEGLIRRVTDPNDRRNRHVNLTPEGTAAMVGFSQAVEQVEQTVLGRLDEIEAVQFKELLTMAAGLEDHPSKATEAQDESAHICRIVVAPTDAC